MTERCPRNWDVSCANNLPLYEHTASRGFFRPYRHMNGLPNLGRPAVSNYTSITVDIASLEMLSILVNRSAFIVRFKCIVEAHSVGGSVVGACSFVHPPRR